MNQNLAILVLSSLLRNIGRFAISADHFAEKQETADTDSKNHTTYTKSFITDNLSLPDDMQAMRKKIAEMATLNDQDSASDLLGKLAIIADRLAIGAEHKQGDVIKKPMTSVFNKIEIEKHRPEDSGSCAYDFAELTPENDSVFPFTGERTSDLKILYDHFLEYIKKLPLTSGANIFTESLISALERFTWCFPVSTHKSMEDISSFDHAMSAAAIAQALYGYHTAYDKPYSEDQANTKKILLLCGDLSGIQNYIFHVKRSTGGGVSKILRARSFFLQALTKGVILSIQRRLNIFSVCSIMASGGKFFLLLPNTKDVRNNLEIFDHELQEYFVKKFKGILSMHLSWSVGVTETDFTENRFYNKIDNANDAIEKLKYRRLKKFLTTHGPILSDDYNAEEGGNCRLCGIFPNTRLEKRYKSDNIKTDDSPDSICSDCYEQINYIGAKLPKTGYIIFETKKHPHSIPLFDGLSFRLIDNPEHTKDAIHIESMKHDFRYAQARMATHLPVVTAEEKTNPIWSPLFEKDEDDQRIEEGQIKTFGMIASKSLRGEKDTNGKENLIGNALLGFLKADIDNLGMIFSWGMKNNFSMARFAFAARMFNFFFSDYISALVKNKFPDIYVVFAGGDDLFLVGPWHETIRFAIELQKDFRRFCCKNDDITISAGILIAKPRFPMRRAADKAEEMLEKAKSTDTKDEKNAVCILDEIVSWDELHELIEDGKFFDKAIQERDRTNFSASFMHRLLKYHKMYKEMKKGKPSSAKYVAHAHYDIGRNILKKKAIKDMPEASKLYDLFQVGQACSKLDKLNISLFYAMNLNRK